jgi:hypothetical protein
MGNPDFFFKDPMLWMSQKQRKEIAAGGQALSEHLTFHHTELSEVTERKR